MTVKEHKAIVVKGVQGGKADWICYTELCKGCGLCLVKCPINKKNNDQSCLDWSKEVGIYSTPAVEPTADKCIGCGTCAMLCPDSAIRIEKK